VLANTLKELGFKDLGYLMNPGIYVLCYKEEVIYVGRTTNIFNRISDSDHRARTYDKIYFVKCNFDELDRVEALMILKLKPKEGKSYNFNNNTDYRNKPTPTAPGQSFHTINVSGTSLELKGWRRV
jgi:hypothetical protein